MGGQWSKVKLGGGVMSVVELGDRVRSEVQQASVTTSKVESKGRALTDIMQRVGTTSIAESGC